jgi:hypothetical protein
MGEILFGTGEDIDRRQALVRKLLDWACAGGQYDEFHPNYVSVTEGRDRGQGNVGDISSCGELAHWLLYRLGARQDWINRREHRGWIRGVNVSALCYSAPNRVRKTPVPSRAFEVGDIIVSWADPKTKDAHVMVVYEFELFPLRLIVAEYGAPGGQIAPKNISVRGDQYILQGRYGTKPIQRWLPLHLVLTDAAERGELVEVSMPWEVAA